MKRRLVTGIDIGTHQTKVVVVEEVKDGKSSAVRIVGTGIAPSKGMRHGYVVDVDDAADSVRQAVKQAEQTVRASLNRCFLAIGGVSLDEARATGEAVISRADQEVTDLDIEKVLESARQAAEEQFLKSRWREGTGRPSGHERYSH